MAIAYATPPPSEVIGTAGNDRLYGSKGADRVDGLGGVDTFVTTGASYLSLHRERDARGDSVWMVGADTLVNIEYVEFSEFRVRLDDPVHLQPTQHANSLGADVLIGNDLGYALSGGEGDDLFTGNGGNDTLYGGKGNDTAVYRGKRADYKLSVDTVSRLVVVSDQTVGRDGQDTLSSIETLRFADGELAVSSLLAAVPAQPALPADQTSPAKDDGVWRAYFTSAKYDFESLTWDVKTDRTWVDSNAFLGVLLFADNVTSASAVSSETFDPLIEAASDEFVDLMGLANRNSWKCFDGCFEP